MNRCRSSEADQSILLENSALTFDDVLILPGYSEVLPADVDTSVSLCSGINLAIPLLTAAMDTVTQSRMAIAIADLGGLGIIHRNQSVGDQAAEVEKVKKYESFIIKEPVTVSPDTPLSGALNIMSSLGISGLPVVEGSKLVGLLTRRDTAFEDDGEIPVSSLMTQADRLVTGTWPVTTDKARLLMKEYRVEKLPLVNENLELCGLVTMKDIRKKATHPQATKDSEGRLICGAAIGTGGEALERAAELVQRNVDALCIDTAHGDSSKVLETLKSLKSSFPEMPVIAGNIATAAGAGNLASAGADVLKIGVGPGSICTTRIVAGVGVPQLSAIRAVAGEVAGSSTRLIADGGIRHSGDINKALAAGAHAVMVGSLLAGTDESPSELISFRGKPYKVYRGMGSLGAMQRGARDRYGQSELTEMNKLVPEGVEGMVPYKGSLELFTHQLVGGIRSGMGYMGAGNLSEIHEKARFIRISANAMKESHVHDVVVTHEPPNYMASNLAEGDNS